MQIAPHQIHNVLKAYAKRLKNIHDSLNNGESDPDACSSEDKRRLIAGKISTRMIAQMVFTRHKPGLETDLFQTPEACLRKPGSKDRFTYHMITPKGEKITAHMEIEDPDFLISRMDRNARDAEKNT